MKKKDRISEREDQDRIERLLKIAFNTQLQPLKSLKTATRGSFRCPRARRGTMNTPCPCNVLMLYPRFAADSFWSFAESANTISSRLI
jgi:hypothetical protein